MAVVVDVTNGDVRRDGDGARRDARPAPARVAGPGEHNAPLTELFEPGSTNKLITLSWAIEHGHVTPDTMFTGSVLDQGRPARQAVLRRRAAHRRPTASSTGRPPTSCASRRTSARSRSRRRMHEPGGRRRHARVRARHADVDRLARTSPPGCCSRRRSTTRPGKYSTAIGYGVAVTGMQMLDAFATIANGGVSRARRTCSTRRSTPRASGTRAVDARGTRVVSREHRVDDDEDAAKVSSRTAPARARRSRATSWRARPERRRSARDRRLLRRGDDGVVHRLRAGRPSAVRDARRARRERT